MADQSKNSKATATVSLDRAAAHMLDGVLNTVTGRGERGRDPQLNFTVAAPRRLQAETIDNLLLSSDVANNAINIPAGDAWRKGVILRSGTEEETRGLSKYFSDIGAVKAIKKWEKTARSFGGALLWPALDGGGGLESRRRDGAPIRSIKKFYVFDPREAHGWPIPHEDPDYYRISLTPMYGEVQQNFLIHPSRVFKYVPIEISRRVMQRYEGWGPSVFEKMWEPIMGFMEAWNSVGDLLRSFAQAYFKMKDLTHAAASGGLDNLQDRIEAMLMAQSTLNVLLLDADSEEYGRQSTPVSGLADILEQYKARMSMAFRMPQTLLFGMSPGGLNSTGEADVRMYYDFVSEQREEMKPHILEVAKICLSAADSPTGGNVPDDLEVEFPPLWEESLSEKADIRVKTLTGDKILVDMGAARPLDVAEARGGTFLSTEIQLPISDETKTSLAEMPPPHEVAAAAQEALTQAGEEGQEAPGSGEEEPEEGPSEEEN